MTGDEGSWQFDDEFVARGVPEASLRRTTQPPPAHEPPRNSLGNLPGPRDWAPAPTPQQPGHRPRRRSRIAVGAVAVAAVAALVWAVASDDHAPRPPIAAQTTTPGTASTTHAAPAVLTASLPAGTCLRGTAPANATVDVHIVPCRANHDYELVAVERASGRESTYPADNYWDGPVAARCFADVRRYAGQPRSRWPDYLTSTQFVPRPSGWAAGDRVVYCLAAIAPAHAGSVRHLHVSSAHAIPTDTTPSRTTATAQTLTGRLTVVTHGADVCLGLRSGGETRVVVSTVAGLSWRAAVDGAGHPDRAGSGIATGSQPLPATLRWRAGDRVTLRGEELPDPQLNCGATVFGFEQVTSAG